MNRVEEHFINLHQNPEPSFKEFETHKYLFEKLSKLNCQLHQLHPTGIIAFFDFNKDKTYAIRAEMDALPIEEKTNLKYASKNGFMHACGHDAHMSILLGLCENLNSKIASVNVVAIFQPSEEVYGGALKVLNDNYFQNLKIDAIFGMHLFPKLKYNNFFTSEYLMASATEIDIIIKGKKTHITEDGIDAIKIANEFLSQITVKKDEIFNCGVFKAYGQRNIICDNALLECTYRTFGSNLEFLETIKTIAQKIESKTRASISINHRSIPLLKNDLKLAGDMDITILNSGFFQTDDFAYYTKKYNALYSLLGCGNIASLHSDEFSFDLELLKSGYNYFLNIINGTTVPKKEV